MGTSWQPEGLWSGEPGSSGVTRLQGALSQLWCCSRGSSPSLTEQPVLSYHRAQTGGPGHAPESGAGDPFPPPSLPWACLTLVPAPRFSACQAVRLTGGSPAPRAPMPHFQASSAWTSPPPVNRLWDPWGLRRGSSSHKQEQDTPRPQPTCDPGGPRLCCPAAISKRPQSVSVPKLSCPERQRGAEQPRHQQSSQSARPPPAPGFCGKDGGGSPSPPGSGCLSFSLQVPCDWTDAGGFLPT